MTEEQKKVLEFHKKFDCTIGHYPDWPTVNDQILRDDLIEEEAMEFKTAETIQDIADALGDLLYVVYGAAITYGIDMEPIFNEIHRSNMTKIWPDGSVHRNEAGKVVKPDSYSPANLAPILADQGYREAENLTSGH